MHLVNVHGLFLWKAKKVLQLLTHFKKISDKSEKLKLKKICAYKGSEFYNRSIKSLLQENNKILFST